MAVEIGSGVRNPALRRPGNPDPIHGGTFLSLGPVGGRGGVDISEPYEVDLGRSVSLGRNGFVHKVLKYDLYDRLVPEPTWGTFGIATGMIWGRTSSMWRPREASASLRINRVASRNSGRRRGRPRRSTAHRYADALILWH